ncbi:MAG: YHS domain-containing protein [Ignavibacteria bacterium]|jgi:YHS domain-containing protein|nr:YHS domain-containing protein [Ignavibacteria bacterium]MDH7527847.1 YHS domain-containing protein [Ignavibacteria bacterium]
MKITSFNKVQLIISSVLMLIFLAGNFNQAFSSNVFQDKQSKKEAVKTTKTETQTKLKDSEKLVCVVTGEEADPELKMEYKGETYYFCCKKCMKKFKDNPEKYIKSKS